MASQPRSNLYRSQADSKRITSGSEKFRQR